MPRVPPGNALSSFGKWCLCRTALLGSPPATKVVQPLRDWIRDLRSPDSAGRGGFSRLYLNHRPSFQQLPTFELARGALFCGQRLEFGD